MTGRGIGSIGVRSASKKAGSPFLMGHSSGAAMWISMKINFEMGDLISYLTNGMLLFDFDCITIDQLKIYVPHSISEILYKV